MKDLNKFDIKEKELVNIFSKKEHPFPELKIFLIYPNKFLKNNYAKDLLQKIQGFKNLEKIPKLNNDLYKKYGKD